MYQQYIACYFLLPFFLSILIEVIQVLLIPSAVFSILTFAAFRKESAASAQGLLFCYLGSLLFCRIVDLSLALLINRSLSLWDDVIPAVWYLILEGVLALVFYLVIRGKANALRREEKLQTKALLLEDREGSVKRVVIPLNPKGVFYSKKNPLLRCAMLLSVIFGAIRLGERILYDIFYCIAEATLPSPEEIPVMIAYYLGDLLFALCFYLVGRLLFRWLFPKKEA